MNTDKPLPVLLFLEDEEIQIHMIEAYYKRCPLSSITKAEFFQSPLAAIDRVKQGGIDYFILDMLLGDVSGYTVISNVSRQACSPKIFVYSAYEKEIDNRNNRITEYVYKKSGVKHLFSKIEADIMNDWPQISESKQTA